MYSVLHQASLLCLYILDDVTPSNTKIFYHANRNNGNFSSLTFKIPEILFSAAVILSKMITCKRLWPLDVVRLYFPITRNHEFIMTTILFLTLLRVVQFTLFISLGIWHLVKRPLWNLAPSNEIIYCLIAMYTGS